MATSVAKRAIRAAVILDPPCVSLLSMRLFEFGAASHPAPGHRATCGPYRALAGIMDPGRCQCNCRWLGRYCGASADLLFLRARTLARGIHVVEIEQDFHDRRGRCGG